MFGLGMGELVVVLFIILLLFGAKGLPEIARSIGKAVKEFKDSSSGCGSAQDSACGCQHKKSEES